MIKADGLAAGKGVIVAGTAEEAAAALDTMFDGGFGGAGESVVIEEYMEGEEVSFFALTDGAIILPFGSAQDHKRVGDGDTGPNTGGMGAYSPARVLTPDLRAHVMQRIVAPTSRSASWPHSYATAGRNRPIMPPGRARSQRHSTRIWDWQTPEGRPRGSLLASAIQARLSRPR